MQLKFNEMHECMELQQDERVYVICVERMLRSEVCGDSKMILDEFYEYWFGKIIWGMFAVAATFFAVNEHYGILLNKAKITKTPFVRTK